MASGSIRYGLLNPSNKSLSTPCKIKADVNKKIKREKNTKNDIREADQEHILLISFIVFA